MTINETSAETFSQVEQAGHALSDISIRTAVYERRVLILCLHTYTSSIYRYLDHLHIGSYTPLGKNEIRNKERSACSIH